MIKTIFILCCLSGCAERVIDIVDKKGTIIGGCNAGFDWHFYGLQDSIDYMLYQCAKESIERGHTVSDKKLLDIDFTLPAPPTGKSWNKKIAMAQFHADKISERHLGYILADIELKYMQVLWPVEDDLANGKINQVQFNQLKKEARFIWLGE